MSSLAVALLAGTARGAIHGEDDRTEVYAHPDPGLVDVARRSVLAMGHAGWDLCADPLAFHTQTYADLSGLCPDERFADQPAVAGCTATIIDDDLVLTALHCVQDVDDCTGLLFAGGLYYDGPDALHPVDRGDLYACRQVVAAPDGYDLAIVQVDRPFSDEYAPAPVADHDLLEGDVVSMIGFPGAIPAKIVSGCEVFPRLIDEIASNNCDTFEGNSGSPILDADGAVAGVQKTGAGSYASTGSCNTYQLYTDDGRLPDLPSAAPQLSAATPVVAVVADLCASGWPTSLCGTAAACGDGRCTGAEDAAGCAADCAPPTCGDGVCDVTIEVECAEDCGDSACAPPTTATTTPTTDPEDSGAVGPSIPGAPEEDGCGCVTGRVGPWGAILAVFAWGLGRRPRR